MSKVKGRRHLGTFCFERAIVFGQRTSSLGVLQGRSACVSVVNSEH